MYYVPPTAEQILQFLRHLPLTVDRDEWLERFKSELCVLLPDVDRVSIIVNFDYDLMTADREQISMIQQTGEEGPSPAPGPRPKSRSEAVEYFKRQHHPVERYQIPVMLIFLVAGQDDFASLYLWRKIGQEPISTETILLVLDLHALLASLFLGLIERWKKENPEGMEFVDGLVKLVEETGMTPKQNRILIYLLYGHSYQEIADKIELTIDAVRDSVRGIYKRAGVHSLTELTTKYFLPYANKGRNYSKNGGCGYD